MSCPGLFRFGNFSSPPHDSALAVNQGVFHISSWERRFAPGQPLAAPLKTEVDGWTTSMLLSVEKYLGMQLLEVKVFPPQDKISFRESKRRPQSQEWDRILRVSLNHWIQSFPQISLQFPLLFFLQEEKFGNFNYNWAKDCGISKQKINQENTNIYYKTAKMRVVPLCPIRNIKVC